MLDLTEYTPECVRNALDAAEVGGSRNLAVLAAEVRRQHTDMDQMAARLDESDLLVLRLEAERDEAREDLAAEIRRLHAIEDELLAALQVASDTAREWNDGEWQTGPRGTAAMTALVEALEKLPKG